MGSEHNHTDTAYAAEDKELSRALNSALEDGGRSNKNKTKKQKKKKQKKAPEKGSEKENTRR